MRIGMILYRIGALSFLTTYGVIYQEPLASAFEQGKASWGIFIILFGFVMAAGLLMIVVQPEWFKEQGNRLMLLSHGAALLSILWLILWCFVWLAMMTQMGDKAEMLIKHTSYLHLFGVGFSMASYATGWMAHRKGERSARFLMTVGWAVSYMAWFNLYFQPGLQWLWAPAVGGLLVVLGVFLIERQLKRSVEAPSQLT